MRILEKLKTPISKSEKEHNPKRCRGMLLLLILVACCLVFTKPEETQAASAPAKVTGVTVKNGNYNTLKISWDEVSGADKYIVYRSTSKNGTYTRVASTTSTSLKNRGLTTGKKYYYKVRAYNGKYGSYSAIKSGTPKPNQVKSLKVTAGSNKATVSWASADGVTGYRVYRATSKSGTYKLVKTTSSTSWTDKNVKNSKIYYYKVRAYRTVSGEKIYGAYSSIKSFKSSYASSYEFFLWLSENEDLTTAQQTEAATAASILDGTYTGSTSSTVAGYDDLLDAVTIGSGTTSLSNLKKAITMVNKGNTYRKSDDNFTDLENLRISPILMAVSELQVSYSASVYAHAQTFSVAENLAWGYSNPYAGWYTAEKVYYDAGNTSYAGHYINLTSESYTVTGFAVTGTTMGQSFLWSSSTYGTTANSYSYTKFMSLYEEYIDYIDAL